MVTSFYSYFTGVQTHLGNPKTVAKMRKKVSAAFFQIKLVMMLGIIELSAYPVSLRERPDIREQQKQPIARLKLVTFRSLSFKYHCMPMKTNINIDTALVALE